MFFYFVDGNLLATGQTVLECWANCEREAYEIGAVDDESIAALEARIALGPTDGDRIGIEYDIFPDADLTDEQRKVASEERAWRKLHEVTDLDLMEQLYDLGMSEDHTIGSDSYTFSYANKCWFRVEINEAA